MESVLYESPADTEVSPVHGDHLNSLIVNLVLHRAAHIAGI